MTLKEKVAIYEGFLHQIQMYYSVCLNSTKVHEALEIIDYWSYAHRVGNGEYTERQTQKLIDRQAEKMRDFK